MAYAEHISEVKVAKRSSQQVASVRAGQFLRRGSTRWSGQDTHSIDKPGKVREYLLQRLDGPIET
jgi:hypothetical protein